MEEAGEQSIFSGRRALHPALAPLAWAAVIFVTSCRWIDRDAFIRFVSRFLPGTALQKTWATLWMIFGLVFVKGYRVAEFTLLCLLTFWALRRILSWPPGRTLLLSAGLCLIYAATDEWHQTFVPGRGGHFTDVLIDSIGITLAVLWSRRRLRAMGKI